MNALKKGKALFILMLLFAAATGFSDSPEDEFQTERLQGVSALNVYNYDKAVIHFRKALKLRPDDAQCLEALQLAKRKMDEREARAKTRALAEKKSTQTFVHIRGGAEYFKWKEFEGSETLLTESGIIYFAELEGGYTEDRVKWFRYRLKGFGGGVDYDGAFQDGTPLETTTDYSGLELTLDGDFYPLINSSEGDLLNLHLGCGFRGWKRDLTGEGGYTENWKTFYLSTGIWGRHQLDGLNNALLTGRLELRLPVLTRETVDLRKYGAGEVHLKPGYAPSFYASAEVQRQRLTLKAYLQTLYFTKSDEEIIGYDPVSGLYDVVWQPESLGVMAGLSVGLAF